MESVPFLKSRYLGRSIYLDEVTHLNDHNLTLLATEVNGIQTDTAFYIREQELQGRSPSHNVSYERLLKSANRFAYAIEQEQQKRQRQQSILDLLNELKSVRDERDALRSQIDHLLAQGVA